MKKILIIAAALAIGAATQSCCKKAESPFKEKMDEVMGTSLSLRNDTTGIWETAGWWNSANVLTAVVRYAEVTGDPKAMEVINDVFEKSKRYKVVTPEDSVWYCENYINDYYDDEAWWALGWLDAYKLTGDKKYVQMAATIFEDIAASWDTDCDGGVHWKKPYIGKNSIAEHLFGLTAARLYNATGDQQYLDWLTKTVDWYLSKGYINAEFYVEDGLDADCTPNKGHYYTYNQGVPIAMLAEMYLITKDKKYLDLAENIANTTMTGVLVDANGILRERREPESLGGDGIQFKGIFMRHLGFLYEVTKNEKYKDFIIKNANSIIANNYDPATKSFGSFWCGPFDTPHTGGNSSALECVIEAYNLTK